MKKRMSIFAKLGLFAFSALFILSACEDKYYPVEEIYIDNPTVWDVFTITVNKSEWTWEDNDESAMYFCIKNDSRITKAIADAGGVIVDRVIDNSFYRRLPNTEYLFWEPVGYYAQTVDFEYGPGWMAFNVKQSDLYDDTPEEVVPNAMTFKVTLFY